MEFTNRYYALSTSFISLLFVVLVMYSASDFKGSDQFWYMADVETLLSGGPKVTNNIYPKQIVKQESTTHRPFIHNIPNLYLVLPLASIFGTFQGWIISNIIAAIITAAIMAYIVLKISGKQASFLVYSSFLLLPYTIVMVSQPLAEPTISPFLALGILIYINIKPNSSPMLWCLLLVTVCISYYCRKSFLPILITIPGCYYFQNILSAKKKIIITAFFFLTTILMIKIKSMIFSSQGSGGSVSLLTFITNHAIPGLFDNMNQYFVLNTSSTTFDLSTIIEKIKHSLLWQIYPKYWRYRPYYYPFNLLGISLIVLYFIKNKNILEKRLHHCGIVLIFVHFATVLIAHNSYRYLYVTYPVLIMCSVILLFKINSNKMKKYADMIIVSFVIFLLYNNLSTAKYLHSSRLDDKNMRLEVSKVINTKIPENDNVIVETEGFNYSYIRLGYILRPRLVAFIRSEYETEDYNLIQRKTSAKWLFCKLDSKVLSHYKINCPAIVDSLPPIYNSYALYKLDD